MSPSDSTAPRLLPARARARPVENLYKTAANVPEEWARMLRWHAPGDGISIGCMQGRAASEWAVQAESPPVFCIAVLLQGQLQAGLDGGASLDFQPGMVTLMSTGSPISGWDRFSGSQGFRMLDIRLTPDALHALTGHSLIPLRGKLQRDCSLAGHGAYMGSSPASAGLLGIASDMMNCQLQNPVARNLYLRSQALQALALVLEDLFQKDAGQLLPMAADRQRLAHAQALLQESYGQNWSIASLSRTVGLNEKRLQSGFQALFGHSIHTQLSQIRIDAAARMLAQGNSVTDTAYAVGFSSLSHFGKVFKQAKGLAPKQWALRQTSTPTPP